MIGFPGFKRPYAIDTFKNELFACLYGRTQQNIILFDKNGEVLAQIVLKDLGIKNAVRVIALSKDMIVILDSGSSALIWLDWNLKFLSKLNFNTVGLCDLKISFDRDTLFSLCGNSKKIFSCRSNGQSDEYLELDFSHISNILAADKLTEFTENNFLILDSKNSKCHVVTNRNNCLTLQDSFLEFGRNGLGFVRNPTDINYHNGHICVNDNDNYLVQFFNEDLEFKFQTGGKGDDIQSYDLPITSCLSHDSSLICDFNNDRVICLALPNLKPSVLISNEYKVGEITRPSGLCSFKRKVIVADRTNGIINVYDKSLSFIQILKMDRNLHRPSSVALIAKKNKDLIAVMERGSGTDSKLSIFDIDFNGTSIESEFKLDDSIKLHDPQDMDSDDLNNLYIANTMEREILKINIKGKLVKKVNLADISGNDRILAKCIQVRRTDQTIFTADFEKKIIFHLDQNLTFLSSIDLSPNKEIEAIRSVCPFKDFLLLCVRGKNQLLKISYDGEVMQKIDITSSTGLDWNNPTKIAILDSEDFCIADKENDRIIALNFNGKFCSNT